MWKEKKWFYFSFRLDSSVSVRIGFIVNAITSEESNFSRYEMSDETEGARLHKIAKIHKHKAWPYFRPSAFHWALNTLELITWNEFTPNTTKEKHKVRSEMQGSQTSCIRSQCQKKKSLKCELKQNKKRYHCWRYFLNCRTVQRTLISNRHPACPDVIFSGRETFRKAHLEIQCIDCSFPSGWKSQIITVRWSLVEEPSEGQISVALVECIVACREKGTQAGVVALGVGLVGKEQQGRPSLELAETAHWDFWWAEAEGLVWAVGLGYCQALSGGEQVWRLVQCD